MSEQIYYFAEPLSNIPEIPLLVSCPHAGYEFPKNWNPQIAKSWQERPIDTDWHIEKLYNFTTEMGGCLLWSRFSRYLIDLNRPRNSEQLYQDGRPTSELVPLSSFSGQALYEGPTPDSEEILARRITYYEPYHDKILQTLEKKRVNFSKVLLVEGHSIRRHVPKIRTKPFPDFMLGNDLGKTMPMGWLESLALRLEKKWGFTCSLNDPFRGGHITRAYGKPAQQRYSMQIEMSQDLYMNESTLGLDEVKAAQIRLTLQDLVENLYGMLNHGS